MRITLLLCCLFSLSLYAQDASPTSPYRLSINYGVAGLQKGVIAEGAFTSGGLDRILRVSPKTNAILGLNVQYANYKSGAEDTPCDFILGDKAIFFSFSETYEFRALETGLKIGIEHRRGKFTVRGALLPTLRAHSQITSNNVIDFDNSGRPNLTASYTGQPGEEFTWTDETQRELRYNTPARIQALLEADFALTKRFGIGIGYQFGLTKYELTNYFVEQPNPFGPVCDPTPCLLPERAVNTLNANAGRAYLALRVSL